MKKYLIYPNIIRIGLALVFLANSLTAFFAPSEFVELIEKSFLVNLLPVSADMLVTFIGINDAIVAFLLFWGLGVSYTAIWATLWLLGAMAIRGEPLEILEEAGFLFMALSLAVNQKQNKITQKR